MVRSTHLEGDVDMSEGISEQFVTMQTKFYKNDQRNIRRIASPGNQYVIRLLMGGYLGDYSSCPGLKVIDVGCGLGFDLVSFHMMGWDPYGLEISDEIVEQARMNIRRSDFHSKIIVGQNQVIPFPTGYFDLLLSSSVIHYANSEQAVRDTIREYARVLKTNARIILLTTHPDNWILVNGKTLSHNLYRIQQPDDFRNGETFFVFQDEKDIKKYFLEHFDDIKIGINQLEFFSKRIIHFVVTGLKR